MIEAAELCLSHSVSDSLQPQGLQPARLLCPWGFSRQVFTGVGCHALLHLVFHGFPHCRADSLLSEPPGKSKNTGMGSLSLLQGNFWTKESNQGLLHCRQILYQLSYPGRPLIKAASPAQNTIT